MMTPYYPGRLSLLRPIKRFMQIKLDDLQGDQIAQLLQTHVAHMRAISPPCSVHALDLTALRHPSITFWSAWDADQLLGCGALKQLDSAHAEVKSMRTAAEHLRKGVAAALLQTIVTTAQARGYHRLSLETGTTDHFKPAHTLYERFGFEECEPFGSYTLDPFSVYMTRLL
jgi:putative acetyltransferase